MAATATFIASTSGRSLGGPAVPAPGAAAAPAGLDARSPAGAGAGVAGLGAHPRPRSRPSAAAPTSPRANRVRRRLLFMVLLLRAPSPPGGRTLATARLLPFNCAHSLPPAAHVSG